MTTFGARPGRFVLPALCLFLLPALFPGAAAAQEGDVRGINWVEYSEGLAQGRDLGKPLFIHFTAAWCHWCKKMQKETYTDPEVIRYLTENFAAVTIDTEKLPALAGKYGVKSLPTLWFVDAQGKGLTSIQGYVGPEKLRRVLEYVSTKAYEDVDYQTWVRKHPSR